MTWYPIRTYCENIIVWPLCILKLLLMLPTRLYPSVLLYCDPVNDCAGDYVKCFVASFTVTVCKHNLLTWRHIVPTWGNHSHAGPEITGRATNITKVYSGDFCSPFYHACILRSCSLCLAVSQQVWRSYISLRVPIVPTGEVMFPLSHVISSLCRRYEPDLFTLTFGHSSIFSTFHKTKLILNF